MPNLILGALADAIRNSTIANIITGRKNKAVDYRTVFGTVADAVALLEGLQRGARILQGYGPPDASVGIWGDAYVNTSNSDYHLRHEFGWQFQFRLKGADGYSPQKGIDYFDGRTPRKGVDYRDGLDGKSAYQLWVDAGNTGTVTQYLASLHGGDGHDGARGSVTRWESFAPTNESGTAGDTWYYAISATKYALYECLGPQLTASAPSEATPVINPAAWRLRFTSPDAASGGGSGSSYNLPTATSGTLGGVKSAGSGLAGNVVVNSDGSMTAPGGGGSGVVLEQNLSSGSTTTAPSVAAVAAALVRTITAVLPVAVSSGTFTISTREAGSYAAYELAGATDYQLVRGGVTLAKPTPAAPLGLAAGDVLTLTLTNHTAGVQAVFTLKP